ncbi:DUF3450 domain-containing protein [Aliikangiella coralliicola]|uniref:DUF3450 domain-containing protein n=1 Tax=Aliikangiella coralliicola TaxID=2592383 RepID=A0A545UAZ7_9GAMM|nr:DUF3450 domain-containing protein [Aliikangiella coralliicola]TQV86603.1 DUF3450 domain-containing protein [Aliikangiella coralliicola]
MLNRNNISLTRAAFSGMIALFLAGGAFANPVDQSIAIEKQVTAASAKSQQKVDRFAEKTLELSAEYKNTLRIIESLKIYNNSLENIIASQEKEMLSIQNQMDTIDTTERGVIPLMNEMIASLDKFVQLDLPFKAEERKNRVEALKNNMLRADISNSEKYRKILEAYQTEISYGESIDSYKDKIQTSAGEKQVDFLRFGRVLLVYLTLDGQNAGYYNPDSGQFEALDNEYIRSIEVAIKMANKQAAPELIKLPVPAAKGAN